MERILLEMVRRVIPSSSGRTQYTIEDVSPGLHVTLTGPGRSQASILPWEEIAQVFQAANNMGSLTPTAVDEILGNHQYRHSSTMCALVQAMMAQAASTH